MPQELRKKTFIWFAKRVGKEVYSTHFMMKTPKTTKIKILDAEHAAYLFKVNNEIGVCYSDKPPKIK